MWLVVTIFCFLVISFAFLAWPYLTTTRRYAFVCCILAVILLSLPSMTFLLGNPRPADLALLEEEEKLIWAGWKEGEFIWVLLKTEGAPFYLQLPWSLSAAKQLQRAMQRGEKTGRDVVIRLNKQTGELLADIEPLDQDILRIERQLKQESE